MKRIGAALLWIAGAYCVVRALVEPFVLNFSDPSTYRYDWGGPSLVGVLFVHCGLGVLAATLMAWRLMRSSSRRLTADRPAPPSDEEAGTGRPMTSLGTGRAHTLATAGASLTGQRHAEAAHR
jgi:hypothetical protein